MKTKNISVAIFDIDDTLIQRGKQTIEISAVESINALKAKGIEVLIATGRALYFIQDPIHDIIKPEYTVTINGACVYNEDHEVVYDVPMERSEVEALLAYALKHDLGFATKLRHEMHVYNKMETFQTIYLKGSPKGYILKDHYHESLGEETPMGVFMMGNEALIEASSPLSPDGHYAKAYDDAYDVYSKRAGKIAGIEYVLKKIGHTWENVIAFGDAANDLSMLEHAAIGVAMGNAPQHVKDLADYTTLDIDQDGIEYALKNLNLI